jgi:hypothetical protein
MSGSVLSYCGCRNPETGSKYRTGKCQRWTQRGHHKWYYVIDQGKVYDPATGRWKRDQPKKMGFKTKQEAERALEALVPAIREGTAPRLADRQLTVAVFLDRWLQAGADARGKPWRPSTRTNYGRDVRLYLKPGLGHLKLVDLRSDDITTLWAQMRGGGRSIHTLHYAYVTLNSALNQAVLAGRISRNPCVAARVETPVRPEIRAWEPEHVSRFLEHARQAEPDLAPAFQLAAWRGLRRGRSSACGGPTWTWTPGHSASSATSPRRAASSTLGSRRPSAASARSASARAWSPSSAPTAKPRPSGGSRRRTGRTTTWCSLARTVGCSRRGR